MANQEAVSRKPPSGSSWFESSARQRIDSLVDAGTFVEFMDPTHRESSPHLALFDLPAQFDDGIIVGRAVLAGQSVFVVAQEGRFMGGAIGEVHGAKFLGVLRAATERRDMPVVVLFDTGGVRLQEANAGELAIAEIMRAVVEVRDAGVPVVGLIGGRAGCYGGGSLIAGCCSYIAISEQGRLSVSGPEVIETNSGVEAFDAADRAMVWRTMGGKHRRLIAAVDTFVDDTPDSFRAAAILGIKAPAAFTIASLRTRQRKLEGRLKLLGKQSDAYDTWQSLGVPAPRDVPGMSFSAFSSLVATLNDEENSNDP